MERNLGSKMTGRAAIEVAMTVDREQEREVCHRHRDKGIHIAAVDYGGDFSAAMSKVIERAVVAARRENVISDLHNEEGAVAGAAHEAVAQIMNKAMGLSVGGKIGIARYAGHISVAVFFEIGLLHLNEIAVGLGHRAV